MKQMILKGILLYMTALSIIAYLTGGAEYLSNNGMLMGAFLWAILNGILVCICVKHISYKELITLSGVKLLDIFM